MTKSLHLYLIVLFTLVRTLSFAQPITVSTVQTPQQLVDNVLLGFGVTALNVTINGNPLLANVPQGNVGFFTNSNPAFPIDSGLILTTGNAIGAIGPNTSTSFTNNNPPTSSVSTDPHLNDIAAGSVTNGVVLEFDFIPQGDSVIFNYMFGSDEYPEFSPSTFNDAFGLFLWGPGITGPYVQTGYPNGGINIATIPGGTPVTINNVGDASNTNYYVFNESSSTLTYGDAIQYDGTTVKLTAASAVQCNQLYHIKLAISNVGDQSYDSGVFLEAGSFSSAAVDVAVATVSGDTTIVEGCTFADFIFTRPAGQLNDTLIINYTIGGVAQQGVDYNTLVNPITFLPGEDSVVINLTPVQDNITEGFESVVISVEIINPCGDTIISSGTIYIGEGPIINITETDPTIYCANDSVVLSASAFGGYAPYVYEWTTMAGAPLGTNDTLIGSITQNGSIQYLVTATDNCNFSQIDTVTLTLNQTIAIDTIFVGLATCQPTGYVSVMASGLTGVPSYTWTGPGPNGFIDASVWQNIPSGWYYITVQDNVCSISDSAFVGIQNAPDAEFSGTPSSGCAPFDVTFTNTSLNANNYSWDFGDSQTATSSNLNNVTHTYTGPFGMYTVRLIAFQSAQCSDTAFYLIQVDVCGCTDPVALNYNAGANVDNGTCIYQTGCTDPVALNYNPTAIVDDGSCSYPIPTVDAPNVFSPNNDGTNDTYFLSSKNVVKLELVILNRWGNVLFEKTGEDIINNPINNPSWDGKINGVLANEGVYFYKYVGYNVSGTEVTGHGFLHLITK
ncbi:MAG: choice-of-anchor L domain-containing protein [Flavobacteriales bacterium]